MAKDTEVRQAVGKVDVALSHLTYKVWERVQLDLERATIRAGCSHGNSAIAPPVNKWGGTDGLVIWRARSDNDCILFTSQRRTSVAVKYIHSFNIYIGRSEENGEPWLAPGNSLKLRLDTIESGGIPYYEADIVSAPVDSEEETQMIGPFNFNLEDVLWLKDVHTFVDNVRFNIIIDGPNEDQQEDVYVLGNKSGFWAVEAVPPNYVEVE